LKNKSEPARKIIFEMIKIEFGGLSFWKLIEADIAIFCSDLIDPISTEKTNNLLNNYYKLRISFWGMLYH